MEEQQISRGPGWKSEEAGRARRQRRGEEPGMSLGGQLGPLSRASGLEGRGKRLELDLKHREKPLEGFKQERFMSQYFQKTLWALGGGHAEEDWC